MKLSDFGAKVDKQHPPYIHEIGPDTVPRAVDFKPNKGIVYKNTIGAHGIWAARVPFLPALDSEELKGAGVGRINRVIWRQMRFLYDLARTDTNRATFELRFLVNPCDSAEELSQVQIYFFGKVFHISRSAIRPVALALWEKFISAFPVEDPFNYPLYPITDRESFLAAFAPLEESELEKLGSIVEIRRFEDLPQRVGTSLLGDRPASQGDYIVHPFVPSLDFSAMGRLFEVLATQKKTCLAAISIRPIRLFDKEVMIVNDMAARFRDEARESSDIKSEFARSRARMGSRIYGSLMQEREFLLQVKVHIAGNLAPYGLVEALGSEMMNNGRNPFPTKWISVVPENESEQAIAHRNFQRLEQDDWGKHITHPSLQRLRSIVDVQQAVGAFRLPIPPESGFMAGVQVRSEPFVAPQDHFDGSENKLEPNDENIVLGRILHRGTVTSRDFAVPLRSLTRHGLIGGSTGSGKSTTIQNLIAQLWQKESKVPFLVLYPIDKPDYRALLNVPHLSDDLLVFTVGDESTSPFRFNPFQVPTGILLRTHISRLMRAFSAAFDLFPPLPMIYRRALQTIYTNKGWNIEGEIGDLNRPNPTMSDFYRAIDRITQSLQYEGEVYDNIRQASVIRIADLLANAGSVVNIDESPSFHKLLSFPTVLELGRIGSQEDISLIMGFLLIQLTETLEKSSRQNPHITVVEEAHRLMPAGTLSNGEEALRSRAGEDFSNLLAEIRGHNAGLLVAEQMPTRLVPGAIGNTYLKIMHWQEDRASFDLFADIMNLSDAQRSYARRLQPGEAIVRNRFGRPVHIHVDASQSLLDGPSIHDDEVRELMQSRIETIGLEVGYSKDTDIRIQHLSSPVINSNPADLIFTSPYGRACSFCRPLMETGNCLYEKTIQNLVVTHAGKTATKEVHGSFEKNPRITTDHIRHFAAQFADAAGMKHEVAGVGYCGLAAMYSQIERDPSYSIELKRKYKLSLQTYPWDSFYGADNEETQI